MGVNTKSLAIISARRQFIIIYNHHYTQENLQKLNDFAIQSHLFISTVLYPLVLVPAVGDVLRGSEWNNGSAQQKYNSFNILKFSITNRYNVCRHMHITPIEMHKIHVFRFTMLKANNINQHNPCNRQQTL